MNKTKPLREVIVFLLGVVIGLSEFVINLAERGVEYGYTPFWNVLVEIHWFWDVVWGLMVLLVVLLIFLGGRK